ncbi:MAG: hypothetical protein Kow00121_10180 [Elainellaceae cyanobacterium]
MGDSVDDLLAQMQAKYTDAADAPKNKASTPAAGQVSPAVPAPLPAKPSALDPSDPIDRLLLQVQESGVNPPSVQSSPHASTRSPGSASNLNPSTAPLPDSTADPLLGQIKAQYEQHDRAEALKKQEAQQQEQRRQEQLKRQRRAALHQRAEAWLKSLDPRSGEAVWFEEFAGKYHSRIEAAIDYLGLESDKT